MSIMCMSDKLSQQHSWIWICFTKKTVTNDLIIGAERVNDRLSVGWKKTIFRYKYFLSFTNVI